MIKITSGENVVAPVQSITETAEASNMPSGRVMGHGSLGSSKNWDGVIASVVIYICYKKNEVGVVSFALCLHWWELTNDLT